MVYAEQPPCQSSVSVLSNVNFHGPTLPAMLRCPQPTVDRKVVVQHQLSGRALVAQKAHVRHLPNVARKRATPVCRAKATSIHTGPVVKHLTVISDDVSLQQAIMPTPDALNKCNAAVTALQKCLTQGTAQLVGSVAADLHLPRCDADVVVLLPDYQNTHHHTALAEVALAVKSAKGQSEGFSSVQQDDFSVQCSCNGINVDIVVGSAEVMGPLQLLDSTLTGKQRQALSASTTVATTAFLQQQPALFRTAVRLVKYWAKHVHGNDWNDKLRNRPKSYLLVLLTYKAYQQYMAAEVGTNSSSSSSSGYDQAAALGRIMLNFLRLTAQLSSSTLLFWEVQYDKEVVQQVLARPGLAHTLRPKGCEVHPIVLDPANPTNNVAAAVPDISRLVQLAAADLAAVEGDMIRNLEQQLQQLRSEQQRAADASALHGKQLAALVAYHTIMNNSILTGWSWKFDFPVSAWLPDSKVASVAGPVNLTRAPGLYIQAFSLPYKVEGYGNKNMLAGIEIRLGVSSTPELQRFDEMGLSIPFTVLGTTTIVTTSASTATGPREIRDTLRGALRGARGRQLLFKRARRIVTAGPSQ